jgi:hypothetical protein
MSRALRRAFRRALARGEPDIFPRHPGQRGKTLQNSELSEALVDRRPVRWALATAVVGAGPLSESSLAGAPRA